GGFVRNWVVGHYTGRPANLLKSPKDWIETVDNLPSLKKEVVPCDLDCHLPSHAYFDIDKFQDDLYKYGISCTVSRQDWRYVLLLDENEPTGPFTMDLIEPHVVLTHDRIDFDVNNLSLEKDYTHELGIRIDIERKPYSIELETIVDNIKNKRFQLLRPRDFGVNYRINKMTQVCGWTQIGPDLSVLPDPHFKYYAILVPLSRSAALYTEELFHGTKGSGIDGITEDGYDDRFFTTGGLYGHGAYFADDPQKSHSYTSADPNNQTRVMYYDK
ncbi:unnamed protein product, partial [Rotaria sp. Silwood1]